MRGEALSFPQWGLTLPNPRAQRNSLNTTGLLPDFPNEAPVQTAAARNLTPLSLYLPARRNKTSVLSYCVHNCLLLKSHVSVVKC